MVSLPSCRYTRATRRSGSTTHTRRVPAESQSATLARISPGWSPGDSTSTARSGARSANPVAPGGGSRPLARELAAQIHRYPPVHGTGGLAHSQHPSNQLRALVAEVYVQQLF